MKQPIEDYFERCGGKGWMHIERLLDTSEMGDHVAMYAKVTIDPHSSLGYHEHHGDGESYFILEGEALYQDHDTKRILKPGDVTFTPSGRGHGIENTQDTPLVFMALIIKES